MYRVMKVYVKKDNPLFAWCENVTKLTNNVENAALYRCRQVLTAVKKEPGTWTQNEKEVISEVSETAAKHGFSVPESGHCFLSYKFLDKIFRDHKNPDYLADGIPSQTAQAAAKRVTKSMKAYFSSCREYKKDSSGFTGRPQLPGYHKSGGNATAIITNQDCVVHEDAGKYFVKLPLTKERCSIGHPTGTFKQAEVIPSHGIFILSFIFDDMAVFPDVSKKPSRIAAIDIGVDNFASITSNTGEKGLLLKGGAVKSANQLYNKAIAKIMSEQTLATKGKFVQTHESEQLLLKRDSVVSDYMHKAAVYVIRWLIKNGIDTLVLGHTNGWKDSSNLDDANNQNFVQIPYNRFMEIMEYKCAQNGIRFVVQEESYTSKASFIDNDTIPVYVKGGSTVYSFSGKRRPTRYAGMYKKDGFRGLYTTADGTIINSDLNGSANIGRKAFPGLYSNVNFGKPDIVRHPDITCKKPAEKSAGHISHAKQKRLLRKNK